MSQRRGDWPQVPYRANVWAFLNASTTHQTAMLTPTAAANTTVHSSSLQLMSKSRHNPDQTVQIMRSGW